MKKANDYIFSYAVGFDMTRRDLQQWGKDKVRPWDFGKDFDEGNARRGAGEDDVPRL